VRPAQHRTCEVVGVRRAAATPTWLDPALDRLPAGTAVQTADFMSGYLLWRHPDLDPVVDGYSELDYLEGSEAARTAMAENYTGLPF